VCDGPGDDAEGEAVASGDVAPAAADGEPTESGSAEDVTPVDASAEPAPTPDDSVSDDPTPDDPTSDETVPDDLALDASVPELDESVSDDLAPDASEQEPSVSADSAPEDAPDQPEVVASAAVTAVAADAAPLERTRRLRPYLRRGVAALVAAGFVALGVGVGAFAWLAPSPEAANRRFVEAAQSQGHVVAPEQQPLVVSAARKICDRRVINETDRERRATALTSDEIAAVGTAFGADTRDFTTLALKTYCSS
jgi:hypothetical protein